jgi:vacuolar iron transporter family protein
MQKRLPKRIEAIIHKAQLNEITEHHIYKCLASKVKHKKNKQILTKIAKDELKHYNFWKKFTGQDYKPKRLTILKHKFLSSIFGLVFSIKLMEKGEDLAQKEYKKLKKYVPNVEKLIKDEHDHEEKLIKLIKEERLEYIGSVVLGLNDAIVELTGALAGLTLAFRDSSIIAIAGLITGIAAALSMGASEYLSTKAEEDERTPLKAAIYTGIAYGLAVILLVTPFFIFTNVFLALALTVIDAILIILFFTFYMSIAKNMDFKRRFFEMVTISLGVAFISFLIGLVIRYFIGIEI